MSAANGWWPVACHPSPASRPTVVVHSYGFPVVFVAPLTRADALVALGSIVLHGVSSTPLLRLAERR